MGKKITPFSKMTLSYDIVFLVLIRIALTKEPIEIIKFRCKLKPSKKRNYIKSNEALLYSSCAAAVLSYYKYIDDINDTKNKFKKFFLQPMRLFFSHMKKKACRYYPELENQIKAPLLKLAGLEKNKCRSIDEAAACFAKLMQDITSFGLDEYENSGQIKLAEIIGWHLGRWLYIIDALDDYPKDLKKGEYNPFIEYYDDRAEMFSDIDAVKSSLTSSLSEISLACSFLDNSSNLDSSVKPIILNIINLGLCEQQEKILSNYNQQKGDFFYERPI